MVLSCRGQAVSEKLMEFEQELERENYIQAVAEKYHIGFDNLRKMVNRSAMRAIGREVPKSTVDRERKEIRKKSQDDGMKQSQRLIILLPFYLTNPPLPGSADPPHYQG